MSKELNAAVEAAVDSAAEQPNRMPNEFITRLGVKFRLKSVNRLLVVDAGRKIPIPKPPTVFIEDKGRAEENPNDPDYQDALREAQYARGMTAFGVFFAKGTEVISVPDNFERHTDKQWADDLRDIGIDVAAGGLSRYVAWVKYYTLSDDDELTSMQLAIMRLSGMTLETDVKDAEASFRGS